MEERFFDKSNGLWYERAGDYYLPCIELPEEEFYDLGRFARAHFRYLQRCRKAMLTAMQLDCTLNQYLREKDTACENLFSQLVEQMTKREGVTEQLKAEKQMEWVRRMNSIRNRADEIVNAQLIYAP